MSGRGADSTVARGHAAELMAADCYRRRGCEILAMNYRIRGGEIDLIIRDGDTVAFVEVKQRSGGAFGDPSEAVDITKRRRVCRAALRYAYEHGLTDATLRFDVCAILGDQMTIYENAFDYIE